MKLLGALILFLTVSTVCGLRCYTCTTHDPDSCTQILNCPAHMERCFTLISDGTTIKGCAISDICVKPFSCCKEDLCNGAIPTGPSVMLLLVSSAIITLFL